MDIRDVLRDGELNKKSPREVISLWGGTRRGIPIVQDYVLDMKSAYRISISSYHSVAKKYEGSVVQNYEVRFITVQSGLLRVI